MNSYPTTRTFSSAQRIQEWDLVRGGRLSSPRERAAQSFRDQAQRREYRFVVEKHARFVGTWSSQQDHSVLPRVEIMGRPVSVEFEPLRIAIDASKYMLELRDDWDDAGSPAYELSTWNRAMDVLLDSSVDYWHKNQVPPPVPRIGKGPEGSIDLHWRTPERELLITVAAAADSPISIYGDDLGKDHDRIEGIMPQSASAAWLLEWLTK